MKVANDFTFYLVKQSLPVSTKLCFIKQKISLIVVSSIYTMYVYWSIPIRRTTWNLCNFYIPLTWCAWSCTKIKCNSGTITTTTSNVNIDWNKLVLFSLILPKAKKHSLNQLSYLIHTVLSCILTTQNWNWLSCCHLR